MGKIIEAVYTGYLQNEIEGVSAASPMTETEKKLDSLLEGLIPKEKWSDYEQLKSTVDCDHDIREFSNAFRIGFMLCAEVFLNE